MEIPVGGKCRGCSLKNFEKHPKSTVCLLYVKSIIHMQFLSSVMH